MQDCVVAHCYAIHHAGSRFTSEVIFSWTVTKLSFNRCFLLPFVHSWEMPIDLHENITHNDLFVLTTLAYILVFFLIISHHRRGLFITVDWELVSGGIFNQSGSVFYRISPESSLLEIQLGKLPTWLPVCYERWNSSLGTLVCRQLGYLRFALLTGSHTTSVFNTAWECSAHSLTYSLILACFAEVDGSVYFWSANTSFAILPHTLGVWIILILTPTNFAYVLSPDWPSIKEWI